MGQRDSAARDFHVRRSARERYDIDASLIGTRGDLLVTDLAAMRRLAARMNKTRDASSAPVQAGEILALGLLHEVGHLMIARYVAARRRDALAVALREVREQLGAQAADRAIARFARAFPSPGPRRVPAPQRLEEMLLTRLANENPALGPLRELVDDRILTQGSSYAAAIAAIERSFADGPPFEDGVGSLIELMRSPARHAPTSLVGQLRFVRERWGEYLGEALLALLARIDIAIGVLLEEERGRHLRFGARPGDGEDVHAPDLGLLAHEPEAFSTDSAWMPHVVLIAKSTYVWLDQLSRTHGRDIRTLDAIPDEELDTLAQWGVTGLWLIGLWERSKASERIKRMRGNPDAVASAYSLDDYRIAGDLGGEDALANLRERAWARGIRLASDMVPNHMGIDSRWVVEHPEWFLSLPEPPYPAYSFDGPDLASDGRAGIVLEDHYWNDTDAAVVFKRFERGGGGDRFIYHGNDGTSFPWNDTAQLDFLDPNVREQVIRTIVDVARRFPVIRFDAAMVLAKRHVQRLWWPLPGSNDGIPSRAQYALTQAEFDRRMPTEFWRDVVDRVAAEAPDTLLLAEAFWMLEGYFVRTLGMHRVYNSAFMHMLRDENGAGYRQLIRDTLEFDPEILKRYVNFMSNPDEKTAVEQFGKGDKYFGVAMVMATMPGLPMLGHGQVQGFGEKYGMEFRRAVLDERPDPWLVERHEREVFPLLHRREWFAEVEDFLLYDFVADDGSVDEHVLAYSNGRGPTRSLVVYHDRFGSTVGTVHRSVAFARKSPGRSKRLVRRTLAEGLGVPDDPAVVLAFRDARTGLQHLRTSTEIREHGVRMSLDGYEGHVFWEFREIRDGSAGQWRRLAERLGGAGVASLEAAMRDLQLEPVHGPLRRVFADGHVSRVLDGTATADNLDALEDRLRDFLRGIAGTTGVGGDPTATASAIRASMVAAFAEHGPGLDRADRAALLGWLALSRIGALALGADMAATSAAWFEELRLAPVLATGLREADLDEAAAWAVAQSIRVLLILPRTTTIGGRGGTTLGSRLLERWLAIDAVRTAIGVNTWQGVEWLERDQFVRLLEWTVRLDEIDAGASQTLPADTAWVGRLIAAADKAGYRVDRLREIVATGRRPRGTGAARRRSSAEEDPPKQ